MIKLLIGGSPCTFWSIAQKNNRETEAEGLGWELFKNYLIAKEKFKPNFFLYENNKSAAQAIKDQIKKELKVWDGTLLMEDTGARYIEINSALVSAQNRQRFYVHNCGEVEQPEDRGILLKDILESGVGQRQQDKSRTITAGYVACSQRDMRMDIETDGFMGKQGVIEHIRIPPYGNKDKERPLGALYASHSGTGEGSLEKRLLSDNPNKQQVDLIAEPIPVNTTADGKARTIRATCYKDGIRNMVGNNIDRKTCIATPIRVGTLPRPNGELSTSQAMRIYSVDGKSVTQNSRGDGMGGKTGLYAIPAENVGECEMIQKAIPKLVDKYGYLPKQFNAYNLAEIDEKSPTLSTGSMVTSSCATTKFERCAMFSPPHGWNEGLIPYKKSHTLTTRSGKQQTNVIIQKASEGAQIIQGEKPLKLINQVYEVKDGVITIKGKQYPIKLPDGYYIIRKLTVTECARLQTMPDDYCRAVSNAQAYKGLGNGWTAEVIIHILNGALKDVPKDEEIVVLSMYDGIGTGRYCLDKMGFTNVRYYAYEIDKYAMQVALSNYPDIIECGDAFAVRNKNWSVK